jgi:leucyl/phenylalanyl-tRNA--protein transferase
MSSKYSLPWLHTGDSFPPVEEAWPLESDAPGLLAAGDEIHPQLLHAAYSNGIFPWYSRGQPVLWWSTDPRMTLDPEQFRVHRSLQKTLRRFAQTPNCSIRMDSAFEQVMHACANAQRPGQDGTWIQPELQEAYLHWHQAGFVHSVETWRDGRLVGGLYCVAIGKAVFGESMFAVETDASKIALAALVCFCREHGIGLVDCQQNTRHLASLGATEIARAQFVHHVHAAVQQVGPSWRYEPLYWRHLLDR